MKLYYKLAQFCKIIVFIIFVLHISCQKDNSIFEPNGSDGSNYYLEITKGSKYIQHLDSYSGNKSIKMYWKTGSWDIENESPVKTIRIYISESGPDEDFFLIHQSDKIGEDSTIIENLNNKTVYYFRLATFSLEDTLLGISLPLMTHPILKRKSFMLIRLNKLIIHFT